MAEICEVCGQALDDDNVSRCVSCGRRFHMAWSTTAPVKNCGRVIFDVRSSGMGFVCNTCINAHPEIKEAAIDPGTPPG
jgi:hypothetical protein